MVEIEWQTARLGILAVFSALRGQLITWSKVCGSAYLPNTGVTDLATSKCRFCQPVGPLKVGIFFEMLSLCRISRPI